MNVSIGVGRFCAKVVRKRRQWHTHGRKMKMGRVVCSMTTCVVSSESKEGNDDVDTWYVAENVQFGLL